jgi:glycosyltransferase involved in cell wall biosynthesis
METEVTALVPTYSGDDSAELAQSIRSLLNQTRVPDDILVVEDGPIPEELSTALDRIQSEASVPIRRIVLNENVGQGGARRVGVEEANSEFITIHDADDIAVTERIEWSLQALEEHDADLVGGYITEFNSDPSQPHAVRKVPCEQDEIREMAKFRSPINQTTVTARRSAILDAGNYRSVDRMEDYELWVRMLVEGFELRNIPKVLAKVRAGTSMYGRRGGWEYAREEIRIQRHFVDIGFITRRRGLCNAIFRTVPRLLPTHIRAKLYETFLRHETTPN